MKYIIITLAVVGAWLLHPGAGCLAAAFCLGLDALLRWSIDFDRKLLKKSKKHIGEKEWE